ncbi:hypothetical protein KM043_000304 [Ampulex compressa]|nr:hypothetical protein KM043_000304 [Ampulex compressa]
MVGPCPRDPLGSMPEAKEAVHDGTSAGAAIPLGEEGARIEEGRLGAPKRDRSARSPMLEDAPWTPLGAGGAADAEGDVDGGAGWRVPGAGCRMRGGTRWEGSARRTAERGGGPPVSNRLSRCAATTCFADSPRIRTSSDLCRHRRAARPAPKETGPRRSCPGLSSRKFALGSGGSSPELLAEP